MKGKIYGLYHHGMSAFVICNILQTGLIKERLTVTGLTEEMWKDQHHDAIKRFIEDSSVRLIVAYCDPYKAFVIEHVIPNFTVEQLSYFIKGEQIAEVTIDNFSRVVQYGSIKGMHIESLLRMMSGIYAPIFFENTSWPDSILFVEVFCHNK